MQIGTGVGLLATSRGSRGVPFIVGWASAKSGSPTIPAHHSGDLMVGALIRVGSAASAPSDQNWTEWATYTGTGCCASVYYKTAASSSEGWGTWSQSGGRRIIWVFRNAARGHINGDGLDTGEATTTLTWPSLNGAASFTGGSSLVCSAFIAANAQTSVTGHNPTGLDTIRLSDPNTSTGADGEIISDTGSSFLTSYAGETRTLDASSSYAAIIFSVCLP